MPDLQGSILILDGGGRPGGDTVCPHSSAVSDSSSLSALPADQDPDPHGLYPSPCAFPEPAVQGRAAPHTLDSRAP